MQNEIDYTYFDAELNILGNFHLPQCLSSSNDKLSLNLKCITNRNKIMKHIRKKTIHGHDNNNNNEMATNCFGRGYNNGKRIYEL